LAVALEDRGDILSTDAVEVQVQLAAPLEHGPRL
jgi:hypothetical protein